MVFYYNGYNSIHMIKIKRGETLIGVDIPDAEKMVSKLDAKWGDRPVGIPQIGGRMTKNGVEIAGRQYTPDEIKKQRGELFNLKKII